MAYVPVRPKDPLIPVLPPPLFLPLFVCGFVYDKAKLVTACGVLTNIAEVYIATAFSHQDIAWVDVFIPCIMPFPTMFGPLNAILLKLPSPKPTVLNIAPNVASRMMPISYFFDNLTCRTTNKSSNSGNSKSCNNCRGACSYCR